jgi:hypothetical protein
VQTETGCWYEADNEVLDLDEEKKVVTVDEAYLDTHLPIIKQRLTPFTPTKEVRCKPPRAWRWH